MRLCLDVLKDHFVKFINENIREKVFLCIGDTGVTEILPSVQKPTVSYGLDKCADVWADGISFDALQSRFTLISSKYGSNIDVKFSLPGMHNILNSLAASAVAMDLNIPPDRIAWALETFPGTKSRFQIISSSLSFGNIGNVTIISDYGHHPTEISNVLQTIRRLWPDRRFFHILEIFRHSRARGLLKHFASVLA